LLKEDQVEEEELIVQLTLEETETFLPYHQHKVFLEEAVTQDLQLIVQVEEVDLQP
jgi:hypothetical protein